ncbi:VOC family protein [Streptomyces marispadix]|uniref:Glyoxalase n=1 Tax=Streptomyces marispadix TaxID=2922868 RepID=A0ABS9SZT0_9ACTN|nr:glyoxalase [Streptomyces marispadix]MCH6161792.1 glyoxalase [Streptomyces marispadix]
MSEGVRTVIFPVAHPHLGSTRDLFRALLRVEPYIDEEYYVGFRTGGQEIGLDPNGHSKGMTGPVDYWHVEDVEESVATLTDAGAELFQEVQDVGEGKRIAAVQDADGNVIGLLQEAA